MFGAGPPPMGPQPQPMMFGQPPPPAVFEATYQESSPDEPAPKLATPIAPPPLTNADERFNAQQSLRARQLQSATPVPSELWFSYTYSKERPGDVHDIYGEIYQSPMGVSVRPGH